MNGLLLKKINQFNFNMVSFQPIHHLIYDDHRCESQENQACRNLKDLIIVLAGNFDVIRDDGMT
jgi:hypothetical protein